VHLLLITIHLIIYSWFEIRPWDFKPYSSSPLSSKNLLGFFFFFPDSEIAWLMLLQVKSKLGILSSYADATDGLVTHGWITKIETHGCFVRFYNGVQGFAPRLVSGHLDNSFSNLLYLTSLDHCY
jgi:hypothetical protein